MSSYYSDYNCSICGCLEKVLVDIDDGNEDLVMPGQHSLVNATVKVTCPFCNDESPALIVSKNEVFVGIFHKSTNTDTLIPPAYEDTLAGWRNEKSSFELFDEDFCKHPLTPNSTYSKNGVDYKVEQTFIREWIEKDVEARLELNKGYAYCYKLLDPKNNVFWLQVEQGESDNAQLNSKEGFILRDLNDVILDISDDTSFPTEIFHTDWFNGLNLSVKQFKSGYEFVVTNHRGEQDFNGFFDTFEEGLKEIESNITLAL